MHAKTRDRYFYQDGIYTAGPDTVCPSRSHTYNKDDPADGSGNRLCRCEKVATKGREKSLQSKYGIGVHDYEIMLVRQAGVCAICQRECPSGRRLAVDHCHATGRVRGLLCVNCNQALGHMRDDPDLMVRAAFYLDRSGVPQSD